ncbi:hypothetical protein DFR86_00190 [Acidianus sulfidivorans JP7]|uniref:Thermopsin n=1 Tax=Acidianus sulfidivorans JP7 TaxID=619593 RepID=A0A2U9IJC1_9CREN|nr:thermopsin [Acidianus sulfidivorans]AWR96121.1 hypothetical protein DFR86_00190 [Acidianus sulfidivorans JP7]
MSIAKNLFLLIIITISLTSIATISSSSTYSSTTIPQHTTINSAIHTSLKTIHNKLKSVVFPPNTHNISPLKIGDEINPYAFYSSEPAPMGIADYGISPNGPFIRETTQWYGVVCISSLDAESTFNTPRVSFQLNVVLNYNYQGNTYALWIQDIAHYDTSNNEICFIDNIWNFTSPFANVTGVTGNGQIGDYKGTLYYYYGFVGSTTLSLPATVQLLVNVSTNSLGQPVIYFWYNSGNGWVNYDVVTVTNVQYASNVYFLVDGYKHTGSGNFYDAELIMGGPGGGSCSYIYSGAVFFRLYYWNGNNLQEVRNAYNFGSDTAETVNNAIVQPYYYILHGILISGLTAGSGSLCELWSQDNTVQLTIYTNTYDGCVYVYNDSVPYSTAIQHEYSIPLSKIPFTGGQITLTLYHMNYAILVYNQNGQLVGEANINTYPGENATTSTTQFSVSVNKPTLTIGVHSTSTVNINIKAYGNVTVNVVGPTSGISYSLSQTEFYVDGSGTDTLTITDLNAGTYTLIVNATLFPGYYITETITVNVMAVTVPFTLTYTVNGQPLPQLPEVTFDFPNGTVLTIPFTSGYTIYVPTGTTYSVEQIISSGSNVRWATENQITGTVNNQLDVSVTYYEQFLISFNYQVINGIWTYTPPSVTYNYFGLSTSTTAPNTVWVDYDSPYQFSQMITSNSQRIVAINYEGTVTLPTTITATYYLQYYVTVNSPIPVYALINGENVTLSSNWYNAGTTIDVENLTYYVSSTTRDVITGISPSSSITINSPVTITVNTITQYYVTVNSTIPVYAIENGQNVTLSSNWFNAGTTIHVENLTYYPSQGTRYVITSISPSMTFTVNSPIEVNVHTLLQYYVTVNSSIPVYALINGSNSSIVSNWFNAGTTIHVENLTYYPSMQSRYVIINISPSSNIKLNSPTSIIVKIVLQYYVTVVSPIPVYAIINGENVTLSSNWYNASTAIHVENLTYYISSTAREVITNISPSSSITINSPIKVEVSVIKQYYVNVNSIIPVKAYVNGSLVYLNSSWINKGTFISIMNYTYYANSQERYIILNITPQSFIVNKPITVRTLTVRQYLVTINGVSNWYNQGSKVLLSASVPIYDVGKFVGTYNVPPGSNITVNSPVVEKLVLSPNYAFDGAIGGIIVVVAIAVVFLLVIRKK